jgi:hypothetical protein
MEGRMGREIVSELRDAKYMAMVEDRFPAPPLAINKMLWFAELDLLVHDIVEFDKSLLRRLTELDPLIGRLIIGRSARDLLETMTTLRGETSEVEARLARLLTRNTLSGRYRRLLTICRWRLRLLSRDSLRIENKLRDARSA